MRTLVKMWIHSNLTFFIVFTQGKTLIYIASLLVEAVTILSILVQQQQLFCPVCFVFFALVVINRMQHQVMFVQACYSQSVFSGFPSLFLHVRTCLLQLVFFLVCTKQFCNFLPHFFFFLFSATIHEAQSFFKWRICFAMREKRNRGMRLTVWKL